MPPLRAAMATLVALALALAAAPTSLHHDASSAATERASSQPNIVVVMADDMRVDELLFAPSIRKLVAARGLQFENSFSPYPLCCPARASFLTGQYAHNHRVDWHDRPLGYGAFDDSRTLATSLRRAGYRTGFIGKYLNGYGRMRSKVSGKPSWRYVPRGWTDWVGALENPGGNRFHGDTYNYFDTPFNVNGRIDNRYRGRYQSNVIGDFSVRLARKYSRTARPFFLYVNYVAPHYGGPRERDDIRTARRTDGKIETFRSPARPRWVRGRYNTIIKRGAGVPRGGGPLEASVKDKPPPFSGLPEPTRRELRALRELTRQRAEAIHVMDRQVRRLIRALKRAGSWDDTVFVFTSDNGYFLGEHRMRTGKVRAHEPSLRVPLVVTGPGMRQGQKRYDPITTLDLSASILDLAGAR
ncbi:sulfatase-like hydrolase/transferase, partial [Nocardioides sp.]|uniref:sulfatase-like hydrolase/transferase n=1 Tax=Nocardioides sp. TaxID=35761 RepID=UPI002736FDB8